MKKVKLFCSDEYSVDDLGNVYSKKGKIIKSSLNPRGYQIVNLMIDGKALYIHRANFQIIDSDCLTEE